MTVVRSQTQQPTLSRGKCRASEGGANTCWQNKSMLSETTILEVNPISEMFQLTPEVYEVQVNDELNDLHSGQVLLPLIMEAKGRSMTILERVSTGSTNPYLGTACSGIIIVVCVEMR